MRVWLVTVVAVFLFAFAVLGAPSKVDCNKGQSINKALTSKSDDLVVEFSGTCAEDVLIARDRVTLRGTGAAPKIVGEPGIPFADRKPGVSVRGASNVLLTGFTVDDSDSRGIEAFAASGLTVDNVEVTDSRTGLILLGQSQVHVRNCDFTFNTGDGIGVWDNSALTLEGTNNLNNNTRAGLIMSGGSSAGLSPLGATTNANDNLMGIWLQLGAQAQLSSAGGASTNVHGNPAVGLEVQSQSHWGASITVSGSDYGVSIDLGGSAEGPFTISSCFFGLYVDAASNIDVNNLALTGNDYHLYLEGGEARVRNSTITGAGNTDVTLEFGARLRAPGSSAGTVSCDGTVLTRGGISCPPAAVTVNPKFGGLRTESVSRPQRQVEPLPLD
jgi:hypothetical protein